MRGVRCGPAVSPGRPAGTVFVVVLPRVMAVTSASSLVPGAVLAVLVAAQCAGGASVDPSDLPQPAGVQELQDFQIGDLPVEFQDILRVLDPFQGRSPEGGGGLESTACPFDWADPAAYETCLSPSHKRALQSIPLMARKVHTSCSCANSTCGCCARVEIALLHLDKTGCINLLYERENSSLVVRLLINDRIIFERVIISGSNPPPVCFIIPSLPLVTACLRFSNIGLTKDTKMQVCIALELAVFKSTLIRFPFGCPRVGPGGISWSPTPVASSLKGTPFGEAQALAQAAFQQLAAAFNATSTAADDKQDPLRQSPLQEPPALPPA